MKEDSAAPASEFPSPCGGERRESFVERVLEYMQRKWEAPFVSCGYPVPPMDSGLEQITRRQANAVFDVHEKLQEVSRVR